MIKVLFVCLGNICRSPLAHGVFEHYVKTIGLGDKFIVDSAGTSSYHVGSLPDERCRDTAKGHGIVLTHLARVFIPQDFNDFDYILVMDYLNYEDVISKLQNKSDKSKVMLLRSFDDLANDDFNVPDPYYGFSTDFEDVYQMCERSVKGFIKFLTSQSVL
jgi:protein-tyrosine phosphatase